MRGLDPRIHIRKEVGIAPLNPSYGLRATTVPFSSWPGLSHGCPVES